MEYGIEGYGLYWLCVELIAGDIAIDNLTFELEDDAELIAHEFKLDTIRVEKIMHRCIELGLFDLADSGRLRCLKLAQLLDESISKNHNVREIRDKVLFKLNNNSDNVQIPETFRRPSDQTRIEENRIDKTRIEQNTYYENSYFSILQTEYNEYAEAYPDINIDQELKKMKLWLDANPTKHKKNYKRFITNWLSTHKKYEPEKEDDEIYLGDGLYKNKKTGEEYERK